MSIDKNWVPHLNRAEVVTSAVGSPGTLIIPPSGQLYIAVHDFDIFNTVIQDIWMHDGLKVIRPAMASWPAGAGKVRPYNDEPAFVISAGRGLWLYASAGPVECSFGYRYITSWPYTIGR